VKIRVVRGKKPFGSGLSRLGNHPEMEVDALIAVAERGDSDEVRRLLNRTSYTNLEVETAFTNFFFFVLIRETCPEPGRRVRGR